MPCPRADTRTANQRLAAAQTDLDRATAARAARSPALDARVERARSDGKLGRAASYAKRFAAKEACAKALGTGLSRGVFWRDMGVINLSSGKPTMALTGGAMNRLIALTPAGFEAKIDLTITDEHPMAQAFVIISAVPLGAGSN